MKVTYLILFVCLFAVSATFGQNLKNYNGEYADGIAKYTYLLNPDMSRKFEGQFTWKSKENPQIQISGKYKNDRKEGLWKSNYGGVKEITNYRTGLKHGKYSLNFENSDMNIKIDACMVAGEIDSLTYKYFDKVLGTISGSILSKDDMEVWKRKWDNYEMYQYYYKEVYLGTIIQDITTGDVSESIQNIMGIKDLVSKVDWESFEIDGEYFKIVSINRASIFKDQDSYQITNNSDYLRSTALAFIYDYHFLSWPFELTRGEVLNHEYLICYKIVSDEEKNNQIKEEKEEKEFDDFRKAIYLEQEKIHEIEERKKKIDDFEIKFYQTEYGRAVGYMSQYIDLPDSEFEIEKNKYFDSQLPTVRSESYNTDSEGQENKMTIRIQYIRELPNSVEEKIYQSYAISTPFKHEKYDIFIVPTKLALKGGKLCISQATIFYLYNPDSQLKLYLQFHKNEIRIRDIQNLNNNLYSIFYIIKNGNNYDAEYFDNKYIFEPISNFNEKDNASYYEIWTNTETDSADVLSKKEVSRSIEDRYNSSN